MHIVDKATELTQNFADNPTAESYRTVNDFFAGEAMNCLLKENIHSATSYYLAMLSNYAIAVWYTSDAHYQKYLAKYAIENTDDYADKISELLCIS